MMLITLHFFFEDVLKYHICQKLSHLLLRLRRIGDFYFLFVLADHSVQVLIYMCVCVMLIISLMIVLIMEIEILALEVN